jgi:hypothetical protein
MLILFDFKGNLRPAFHGKLKLTKKKPQPKKKTQKSDKVNK